MVWGDKNRADGFYGDLAIDDQLVPRDGEQGKGRSEGFRPVIPEDSSPGFPRWIEPEGPKAAETLAKLPIPPFTRRVRRDSAT